MNIFNEIIFGIRSIIEKGEFFTLRKGGWSIFAKEYFSKTFLAGIYRKFFAKRGDDKERDAKGEFSRVGGNKRATERVEIKEKSGRTRPRRNVQENRYIGRRYDYASDSGGFRWAP